MIIISDITYRETHTKLLLLFHKTDYGCEAISVKIPNKDCDEIHINLPLCCFEEGISLLCYWVLYFYYTKVYINYSTPIYSECTAI